MSIEASAFTGVGIELHEEDFKLLGDNYYSATAYIMANDLYDDWMGLGENHVCVVNDPNSKSYEYFMYILLDRSEYEDERFLSIDLDLSSYASEVCEKYKEFFGAELDRSRIKLISFLRYT